MKELLAAILALGAAAVPEIPRIAVIDFYGLRRLSAARIQQELGVKEGDPLPPSKAALEERIETVAGVVAGRVEAVCCEAGGTILYVGILERGTPQPELRDAPEGKQTLPEEVLATYSEFLEEYRTATMKQMNPAIPKPWREKLEQLAKSYWKLLVEVVRESENGEHRAIAAHLLMFGPDKAQAAEQLQYALRDPEEAVRQNALEALAELVAYGADHPDSGIKIAATWPVELLNSLAWADRYGAARLLVSLTEKREPSVMAVIRQRGLQPLIEMARWKTLQHALPAYIVVARLAGLEEPEIRESWISGRREEELARIEKVLGLNR